MPGCWQGSQWHEVATFFGDSVDDFVYNLEDVCKCKEVLSGLVRLLQYCSSCLFVQVFLAWVVFGWGKFKISSGKYFFWPSAQLVKWKKVVSGKRYQWYECVLIYISK